MDNELLEQVSFSIDLLNLERKLACHGSSADDEMRVSVHRVEEALQARGVRVPVDKKAN